MWDSARSRRTILPPGNVVGGNPREPGGFSDPGPWSRCGSGAEKGSAGNRRWGSAPLRRAAILVAVSIGLGTAVAQAGTAIDPVGDAQGTGPDVVRLEARHVGSQLILTLELAQPPLLADSGSLSALVGFIDLDTDRLATTGDLAFVDFLGAAPSGLGDELYVDLSTYAAGTVDLVRSPGASGSGGVVARVPMGVHGTVIDLRLDHALLGTSTVVHTAAVVGDDASPSDVVPDGTFLASTVTQTGEGVLLRDERFEVLVSWRDFSGGEGPGTLAVRSADSAVFWFFDEANWELMVKVVDGCAFNNRYWVFGAATTDVAYTLTITDTLTGHVKTYQNPLGVAAPAITDTGAFVTCP